MAVTLNSAGETHARSLINGDHDDDTSPWSFSAEDGDKLLGPNGNDWTAYGNFHLGEDTSQPEQTKGRFKYPFGKDGMVYRSALRAIRSRASQQGDTSIFDAAGRLMDLMDKEDSTETTSDRLGRRPSNRAAAKLPAGYRIVHDAAADSADIYLYGMIGGGGFFDMGGITADQFRKDLTALGKVKAIDLHINSEGGDVFDGQAMYNLLANHPAHVTAHVDGLAASAASFICMAANEIVMAENSFMMVHNASGFTFGNANDHQKTMGLLRSVDGVLADVYAARTRQPVDTIKQMMDDETWMTGKEALANGFADRIDANMQVTAAVRDPTRYRSLPSALRPNQAAALSLINAMKTAA